MTVYTYIADQADPALALNWLDRDGNTINFSSGYTFTVQLVSDQSGSVALTKTTGITGASTLPNVLIAWGTSDFTGLDGTYKVRAYATSGGRKRVFDPEHPPTVRVVPVAS